MCSSCPSKSTLRVYHVTDVFAPSIGGIETALVTLLPKLKGVESIVLVDTDAQPEAISPTAMPFTVRRLQAAKLWRVAGMSLAVVLPPNKRDSVDSLVRSLSKASARERIVSGGPKPDLIHFHGLGWIRRFDPRVSGARRALNKVIFNRVFRLSRFCRASVYTDHSLFSGSYTRFLANAGPAIIRSVDAAVVVERSGYENALRFIRQEGNNVLVRLIPNPIDMTTFRYAPPSARDVFVIGYVGRISKPGLETIRALWEAAPPWARLILCLADDDATSHDIKGRAMVKELSRTKNVDVRWNLSQAEVASLLSEFDVVLDPYEVGTPRTSLEAMAAGRPVIRFRESIADIESMLPEELAPVVKSNHPEAAWSIIGSYRESFQEFGRMTQACHDFARAFEASAVAQRYVELYHELLGAAGGRIS